MSHLCSILLVFLLNVGDEVYLPEGVSWDIVEEMVQQAEMCYDKHIYKPMDYAQLLQRTESEFMGWNAQFV